MIGSSEFWETEREAPLLNRNANFFCPESAAALQQRAAKLLLLLEERHGAAAVEPQLLQPDCEDEAAKRIFVLDAERTFKSPQFQQQLVAVLSSLWPEVGDYHQGLGFVASFLLLLLPAEAVLQLCVGLHRLYLPGYFKAAPVAYVRDARVLQKLLQQQQPAVAARLAAFCCCPEAYCSKWFVGLNVHVLPFEALLLFFEQLLRCGAAFLFQFALALLQCCSKQLLAAASAAEALEILRLDPSKFPNAAKAPGQEAAGSFFLKIVQDAANIHLESAAAAAAAAAALLRCCGAALLLLGAGTGAGR
ncbi:TBC domain containing protein, related, partial [Eimeria necatrix]